MEHHFLVLWFSCSTKKSTLWRGSMFFFLFLFFLSIVQQIFFLISTQILSPFPFHFTFSLFSSDDLILNLILLLLPGAFLAAFSFVAVLYRIGQIEHLKHCEYIVSSIDLEEESWGKRLFEKFWHITQCGKARHFGYSTWEMNFVRFFMVGFSVFTVVNVVIGIRGRLV